MADTKEIPQNLKELKESGIDYELREGYYLHLSTKTMGFFPAETEDGRMLLAFDKELIIRAWPKLRRRESEIGEDVFCVVTELNVAYRYDRRYQRNKKAIEYALDEEIRGFIVQEDPSIRWARGLLSMKKQIPEERYRRNILRAAEEEGIELDL